MVIINSIETKQQGPDMNTQDVISKTTLNYASKRNVELYVTEDGNLDLIVDPDNNTCSSCQYQVGDNEFFLVSVFSGDLEDMPYWVQGEWQLRQVIDYVATQEVRQ